MSCAVNIKLKEICIPDLLVYFFYFFLTNQVEVTLQISWLMQLSLIILPLHSHIVWNTGKTPA